MGIAIVWFRRDLRLQDHPALAAAAARHERVLPVYIHAPDEEGEWAPGAASRWWLHHSLDALQRDLHRHHGELHLRAGPSLQTLRALIESSGAEAVYWNRLYEPALVARDTEIKKALREQGLHVASFDAALWRNPWQVLTKQDEPYRVFTPFWRNLRAQLGDEPPLDTPSPLRLEKAEGSVTLDALELLPRLDWADGFGAHWTPGERGASDMLERFADDALRGYGELRDRPARTGTSRLSPHLHFGEITPRMARAALREHADAEGADKGLEPYLRELGWRDFAHHVMYHFPHSVERNLNERFDRFAWVEDDAALERWQQGRTGVPLVDAGMRELWATGWMHNRVRMIVASWLTKNMRQHWLKGARWFWDTLVDADLANNSLGWQWVAGSGVDAAPYFRIFNPVTQAQRFDADGEYIRRWVPELRDAPKKLLHEPWAQDGFASSCGYPLPMLDIKASRQRALDSYQDIRD
ncbi:deoxyribodipyrimidine photo-lyase [Oleiagrimonas sp. MCCC 1A03011]|uniref:cryptochrome/photolyase family protein n=1 Tax=Oleiagrimonas sp. MCCC 1A03011 TaxID=1926883 RepID=UPI000DC37CF9|nr:deoxyribodipyrimidine photo-lyase [Oleiagrimonas sp. MCCC 1A03011]RAP57720.1 deoxyribodipyrimidine photolyase [Oleiagrimonas sp. MCCC 1A03011]